MAEFATAFWPYVLLSSIITVALKLAAGWRVRRAKADPPRICPDVTIFTEDVLIIRQFGSDDEDIVVSLDMEEDDGS